MKLLVLLQAAMIILSATNAQDESSVKSNKAENFRSQWKGVACTKKIYGKEISDYRSRNVTISIAKPKRFSFRVPKIWKPGEYICVWKIKANRDDMVKPKPKIDVHFKKLFIAYPITAGLYMMMCKDKIYIKSRTEYILERENYLCQEEDGSRFHTKSDEATIVLEIHIPDDKMKRAKSEKSTRFIASVNAEINPLEPDRFNVKEIVKSDDPYIKDYKFTWDDARQFCQNYAPKWDLCDWRFPVCQNPHKYSHTSVNISIQYTPLLSNYNDWGEVKVEDSSCNPLTYRFGPPVWGIDRLKCPDTGCESKSFVYCCFYKKPVRLNQVLKPVEVKIQSGLSVPGQYHYRFIDKEDYYDYHDYDYSSMLIWNHYWNTAGRIPGDLTKVKLFSDHSPASPIPLYFCSRYDSYSVEKFRFMVSLSPCTEPWKIEYHKYTSTTPYGNLRPLYFGQSRIGEGTRISFTPFCCGFDGPGSFMAYGLYKNSWKAKIRSKLCSNRTHYASNPGTITSPLYPKQFERHTDCTWQVIASPGKRILLKFEVVEFSEYWNANCTQTYLEFSSSTQTYGRLCSSRLPTDFRTTENVLNIKFAGELEYLGRFSMNYTEISAPVKTLVKFTLPNENATWSAAGYLCSENNMQLCRKDQICPFDTAPNVRQHEDFRMIPVGDKHNDWVRGNDYFDTPFGGRFCTSILDLIGPPYWGESIFDSCTKVIRSYGDPICITIKRDVIYCCETNESSLPEAPKPVRVYIGYGNIEYTSIYRFDKDDKMYATLYEISDDYDDGYDIDAMFAKTELWEKPSRYHKNDSMVIDYFVTSETRVNGTFDKVLFFCSQNALIYHIYVSPTVREHRAKLTECDAGWQLDFYLFVSDKKTTETPIALRIGKSATSDSAFCCEDNPEPITVYVADAGVIDEKNPEI